MLFSKVLATIFYTLQGLGERIEAAKEICKVFPASHINRKHAADQAVETDCNLSTEFLFKKKTNSNYSVKEKQPMVLIIPLGITSVCLMVILIVFLTKCFLDRRRLRGTFPQLIAVHSHYRIEDEESRSSTDLVTESIFKRYNSL